MRKGFCQNLLQPFLENIDGRSCNDGSLELIPVFYNSHWKSRPSPSAMALTIKYLVRHLKWRYLITQFHSYSTPTGTFDWWFVVTIKRLSSIMCANHPWFVLSQSWISYCRSCRILSLIIRTSNIDQLATKTKWLMYRYKDTPLRSLFPPSPHKVHSKTQFILPSFESRKYTHPHPHAPFYSNCN